MRKFSMVLYMYKCVDCYRLRWCKLFVASIVDLLGVNVYSELSCLYNFYININIYIFDIFINVMEVQLKLII